MVRNATIKAPPFQILCDAVSVKNGHTNEVLGHPHTLFIPAPQFQIICAAVSVKNDHTDEVLGHPHTLFNPAPPFHFLCAAISVKNGHTDEVLGHPTPSSSQYNYNHTARLLTVMGETLTPHSVDSNMEHGTA